MYKQGQSCKDFIKLDFLFVYNIKYILIFYVALNIYF